MKITDVKIYPEDMPLKVPFVTSKRRLDVIRDYIVEIHTDSGICGFGACAPTPVITGDTVGSIIYAVEEYMKPRLVGLEVTKELLPFVRDCMMYNSSPKAAVDIALYDLLSKSEGKTIYEYMGGKGEFCVKTDITISLGDVKTMVKDTECALEDGYDILKVKLGTTPAEDKERIAAIASVVGKEIPIRLDANQAWEAKDSVEICDFAMKSGMNIELVEQPVHYRDIDGLEYVTKNTSLPILADESAFSYYDVCEILKRGAADMINIKLMKCGGLYEAERIHAISSEYGVECMIGSMMEGPWSVAAAAQFAAAKGITKADLDAPILVKELINNTPVDFSGKFIKYRG
jgi:o-succinylbenzoate synthase